MTLCSLEMHLLLTFMSFQFKIELDILFEGQCVMEIKDFSQWEEYNGNSMGSGRSEKIWLTFGDEIGLFKFPKQATDGTITYEHISEKLAYDIATLLDIPCAKIDIGTYNGRYGSMSYRINKENEELLEGILFISGLLPEYDKDKLYDSKNKIYYSLQMIFPIIDLLGFIKDFFQMIVFDALIGNSDRHHSNWAILRSNDGINFSPLYDNGSSLCCYVKESDIDGILGKDIRRFTSLVTSKSKSRIRIDMCTKKEPEFIDVLVHIFCNEKYREYCVSIVEKIIERMTENNIKAILKDYPENILSSKRKALLFHFLTQKVNIIKMIFEKGVI